MTKLNQPGAAEQGSESSVTTEQQRWSVSVLHAVHRDLTRRLAQLVTLSKDLCASFSFFLFETGSQVVSQASNFLLQLPSPKYWDYKHVLSHPASYNQTSHLV